MRSKLANEKYQNNPRITRIVRLLAEALLETHEQIESDEVEKRFERERKQLGIVPSLDYIAFLLRSGDERNPRLVNFT